MPKGGPDGGDGGRGGSIRIRANRQLSTLLDYQYKRTYKARRGEHGLGSLKTGPSADDIVLQVPAGTLIRDAVTGAILGDLTEDGDEVVVARGGRGGRGNAAFRSPTNQAPRRYELGQAGEEREIELELKLLADIGLVGFPNVGKSTLISVISAARPRIADYPFTTLVPNLGIVKVAEFRSFVVADIPGLIEGAHEGRGLGAQFLRHIERTRALVFLVEAGSADPVADFRVLVRELRSHNKDLPKKPFLVALTKADLVDAGTLRSLARLRFKDSAPLLISSATGEGIKKLVGEMWKILRSDQHADA